MQRILLYAAYTLILTTAHAFAQETKGPRAIAADIAIEMKTIFACTGRACLEKSIFLGNEKTVPERYRSITSGKYSSGGAKDNDFEAVSGVVASFVGACLWDRSLCESVRIEPKPAHDERLARFNSAHGSRALRLNGFRDVEHQVNFLTRMSLVAQALGLEPNAGLGLMTMKGDITGHSFQVTHFDVNGRELDAKSKCTKDCNCKKKKKCSCKQVCTRSSGTRVWGYGARAPIQVLFQSKLRMDAIPEIFASYFLGDPATESLETTQGRAGIIGEIDALTTFFAPGSKSKVEGAWETSMPNIEDAINDEKNPVPRTLDDVRLGKYPYVTLASDPTNYGLTVFMGAVTYTSPIDKKTYTGDRAVAAKDSSAEFVPALSEVVGYVHDTGSAFQGRPDKFDVCIGDFRGWKNKDSERFAVQWYGDNVIHRWTMIRSFPTTRQNR